MRTKRGRSLIRIRLRREDVDRGELEKVIVLRDRRLQGITGRCNSASEECSWMSLTDAVSVKY